MISTLPIKVSTTNMAELYLGPSQEIPRTTQSVHTPNASGLYSRYQTTPPIGESTQATAVNHTPQHLLIAIDQEWRFQRAMRTYAYFGRIICFEEHVRGSFESTRQFAASLLNQEDRFGIKDLTIENFCGSVILCGLESLDLSDSKEHFWRVTTTTGGEVTLPIPMPVITQTLLW